MMASLSNRAVRVIITKSVIDVFRGVHKFNGVLKSVFHGVWLPQGIRS